MSEFIDYKLDYSPNILHQQKNPELENILSESVFPISQKQINDLKLIISKKYKDSRRQQKPDLNKSLSKIWLKWELVDYSYNKESWKIVILSKLSKSEHTVYVIDTKSKRIKDLNLDIPFTWLPSWSLEFIIPEHGFVLSTYNLDDELIDDSDELLTYSDLGLYKYRVYDFDWKLFIDWKNWPKKMQNRNHEKNITWIKNQIEKNNIKEQL